MDATSSNLPASIAVIGAGRLGGVLAAALREAGFDVRGPLGRRDEIPASDIAIVCVPDAAIAAAADKARPHTQLVAHASGATSLTDVDFSIHPLQTFTGTETHDVFRGIGMAIDGRTPEDRETATNIAEALGAHPFQATDRASYHAAASFASNYLLTVLDAAERLATAAGVENPRDLLAPLARQSLDNWQASGAKNALTGPIVRGDTATVASQREAAAQQNLTDLFDALAAETREIATP